ncbi:MAG: hypothetical protein HYV76_02985 [Candidatus Vogelbacteria bacterium]|nr:hypothetical protein [Candidatus Vogelbacteria bacterium]
MYNLLPSKKVVLVILIILLVLAGGLWYLGRTPASVPTTPVEKLVAEVATQKKALKQYDAALLPREFTEKDLIVTTKTDTAILRQYGLALADTLRAYATPRGSELAALDQAIEQKNGAALETIKQAQAIHQEATTKLLATTVPKPAVSLHLSLLFHTSRMAYLAGNMAQVLDEPILALESANRYIRYALSFYRKSESINDFFTKNKVTFQPNEGIIFYLTITDDTTYATSTSQN